MDQFLLQLNKQPKCKPFGKQINGYSRGDHSFEIFHVDDFGDDKFRLFHERLQTMVIFFIDAASFIEPDDKKWTIFLLYERYLNDSGQQCFAILGYMTVYLNYAYPDKIRPRISQMLIFPPHQRQGHGKQLLKTVYQYFKTQTNVLDITAEDPAEEFVALRDYVTVDFCRSMPIFSRESMKATGELTKEMIEQVRQEWKLSPAQTRRVYEIILLSYTNVNDEQEFRKYRLAIKVRLYQLIKACKRGPIEDPAFRQLVTDGEKRKRFLEDAFRSTIEDYNEILKSLDK